MKEHCETIGKPEVYDAYAGPKAPDKRPPQLHLDTPEDNEMGAWANLEGMHWDAHVMYVPDDTAAAMLDMLLKVLCLAEMGQPDNRCGDGACEDCPVTGCLEMLRRALVPYNDTESDEDGRTEEEDEDDQGDRDPGRTADDR